jgi:hypothetical protein
MSAWRWADDGYGIEVYNPVTDKWTLWSTGPNVEMDLEWLRDNNIPKCN